MTVLKPKALSVMQCNTIHCNAIALGCLRNLVSFNLSQVLKELGHHKSFLNFITYKIETYFNPSNFH